MRLQQHRSIDVGDATLECTLCGSGAPVVLLANAGCSTGYFDHLARSLGTGGFQTISINMRGVRGSAKFGDQIHRLLVTRPRLISRGSIDTGRDPVVGELVASDIHEIVIRRTDREIGEVCVLHAPALWLHRHKSGR